MKNILKIVILTLMVSELNASLLDGLFDKLVHESGTWQDDPENWKRVFGIGHKEKITEIHSYYWRSPNFTVEYEYFFELEVIERGYTDWINNLIEMNAEVKKKKKECVSLLSDTFLNKPRWFISDNKENYRCFSNDNIKVFFNTKNRRIYMTESQI